MLCGVVLALGAAPAGAQPGGSGAAEPLADTSFDPFVEPDFPFITTTVDARHLGPVYPSENVAVRGIALRLGHGTYATFDPDLLRMSVGWTGEFVSMGTMAQVSYHDWSEKSNRIPEVLGEPVFATGLYPGWSGTSPQFEDPRPPGPNPDDPGRGPIDRRLGAWNGLYVSGDRVTLSYRIRDAEIFEQPSAIRSDGRRAIVRTVRVGPGTESLTMVAGEVRGGEPIRVGRDHVRVHGTGATGDSTAWAFHLEAPGRGARLALLQDRYAVVRVPPREEPVTFRLAIRKAPPEETAGLGSLTSGRPRLDPFREATPRRWAQTVSSSGEIAPDTGAFVVDDLGLPIPNPWRRNVRPADVAFFEDGRAALVTFSGDVWIVSGIDRELGELQWRRFASGLYEPLSVEIVDGEIYVYGREGIVRLEDPDGDGEAEFYANFSNGPIQSIESREFPLDMEVGPEGRFYVSMGGALDAGPETSEAIMPGFRAGSAHSGTILRVGADGRSVETFATGFREPYLGVHPETGWVTASDQQGRFVPSTPVYYVAEGGFYGVPATAHRSGPTPEPTPPIAWIPHFADDSGASQRWIPSGRLGPLGGELVHFSYGRPGLFRVYFDRPPYDDSAPPHGAVVPVPAGYEIPTVKGAVRPRDGHLYLAGFQIYGSRAGTVKGLRRLRYTGRTSSLPAEVDLGRQGLILRFPIPLDSVRAADPTRYGVTRWNYRRTEAYGSGHFLPSGEPGEETLPVAAARVSEDGSAVLLVLPDMREIQQMEITYDLRTAGGTDLENVVYATVNRLGSLDLRSHGFPGLDWQSALEAVQVLQPPQTGPTRTAPPTARRGRHLFQELGCNGCHPIRPEGQGVGPSLRGVFGSTRTFEDGSTARVDSAYLRESILDPGARIVEGFEPMMASYRGTLGDEDVTALIRFIRTLSTAESP